MNILYHLNILIGCFMITKGSIIEESDKHKTTIMTTTATKITTTKFENEFKPSNCYDLFKSGFKSSGIYTIYPENEIESVAVYCEMHKGGWTRVSNKVDASKDAFHKPRKDYINGFGDINSNHWIGLSNLRKLTNQQKMAVRIELYNNETDFYMIEYDYFFVGPETENFRLTVGKKTYGSLTDYLGYQNGMPFSTFDKDLDMSSNSCADISNAGWWYKDCYRANVLSQHSIGQWCLNETPCLNNLGFKFFNFTKMMVKPDIGN